MKAEQAVGFFDSGLGGLGVLASAARQLPHESFIYLGDSVNAPYGTKTNDEVRALTLAAAERLAELGVKALVVACNTATGAAIDSLRQRYPMPVIGLEPALKVASEKREQGTILVMATPLTLASAKYAALYEKYGEHAVNLPCPGLMDFVENEAFDSRELDDYLEALFAPYLNQKIDSVVLGCTHYLFLRKQIRRHLRDDTAIIDSNEGVTRQLARKLDEYGLQANRKEASLITLMSTGGEDKEKQMARMLGRAFKDLG